jgi:transcription antitermination factor NusG
MIWYALQVRGSQELAIANDLRAEGHTVFVPVERIIRAARNAKGKLTERETIKPLVTSYVFCDAPYVAHKHVYGPVTFGSQAYGIPDAAMTPLKALNGRDRREGQQVAVFTIGQVVKLTGGSFEGKSVTITKRVNGKVVVLMDIIGGPRRVVLTQDQIAA